jgi:hypothetical protein
MLTSLQPALPRYPNSYARRPLYWYDHRARHNPVIVDFDGAPLYEDEQLLVWKAP